MTGLFCRSVTNANRFRSLTAIALCFCLSACGKNTDSVTSGDEASSTHISQSDTNTDSAISQRLIKQFSDLYQRARTSAAESLTAIQLFLGSPSAETLEAAQLAWQQSHDDYLLAQVSQSLSIPHPVLDSPVSDDENIAGHTLEIRLDQYPAIPGYLDSVNGYQQSGLIHTELPLTLETLQNEHQLSDTAYVALGYHALQVMLFAESTEADARHHDFLSVKPAQKSNIDAAKRRREITLLLATQIVDDITLRHDEWRAENGFYRDFVLTLAETTVEKMLRDALDNESIIQQTSTDHISSEILSQRAALLQGLLQPVGTSDKEEPAEKSL